MLEGITPAQAAQFGGVLLAVAVFALALAGALRRAEARGAAAEKVAVSFAERLSPRPRIAVIVNPTKLDHAPGLRTTIAQECRDRGLGDPLWLETSAEDSGLGPAREAVQSRVTAIFVFGGDGTVRAVLGEAAGTGIPIALLPAGTGNLLARNLDIPVGDLNAALAVAFTGRERRIDLATVETYASRDDREPQRSVFTVMAGLGFDAEVMAAVEPELKRRVGWWAYVVAGLSKLSGRDHRLTIVVDGAPELQRRARSVIIGNCGTLTAGIRLMPDAVVDDGLLDLVIVAPRGAIGWASVLLAIISGRRRGHPRVEHMRGKTLEIRAQAAMHVQLDGDALGTIHAMRVQVDPGVSVIRVAT